MGQMAGDWPSQRLLPKDPFGCSTKGCCIACVRPPARAPCSLQLRLL